MAGTKTTTRGNPATTRMGRALQKKRTSSFNYQTTKGWLFPVVLRFFENGFPDPRLGPNKRNRTSEVCYNCKTKKRGNCHARQQVRQLPCRACIDAGQAADCSYERYEETREVAKGSKVTRMLACIAYLENHVRVMRRINIRKKDRWDHAEAHGVTAAGDSPGTSAGEEEMDGDGGEEELEGEGQEEAAVFEEAEMTGGNQPVLGYGPDADGDHWVPFRTGLLDESQPIGPTPSDSPIEEPYLPEENFGKEMDEWLNGFE